MPSDDAPSHPEDHSEIKAAEFPAGGFSSKIPEYLLEGKSEAETYILKEVSKMSQFIEWSGPLLLDNNLQARRTNGRVKKLEGWQLKLTTGWGMVATSLAFILAVIGGVEGIITLLAFLQK